ncbi:MAG: ABC transporter ATP-binding protein [Longimicrobiales bacterium]
MASVKLHRVHKVYGNGFVAVHELSLETGDGEFVVLVGPSGCGKSTTLRMLAGLESVTSGTLSIGDRIVNDVAPRDRDIAMVFQNYALYPHMSVFDNLAFGLKLRKLPKADIDRRVRLAAATLDIEAVLDRKPAQLSGGQRQRVAVGRAIVREPQVFLFDEPLSNLDAKLRAQTRKEIARLHRQLGATMIYVTHDQVEAMTLGDRIVVMDRGFVQQIASPLELYERPVNRFVAGFIGSPAMNFIDGRIEQDGGLRFVSSDRVIALVLDAGAARTVSLPADVTLGVRPEHIALAGPQDADAVPVTLDVVEPMGNELILYARTGDHEVVARVPPGVPPEPGSVIRLTLDTRRIHVFDAKSGAALR